MRAWNQENVPKRFPVGRTGMHRYDNQDHSMYTAMPSVENILGADHDIWNVNVEEEYHEEMTLDLREGPKGTARTAPITPAGDCPRRFSPTRPRIQPPAVMRHPQAGASEGQASRGRSRVGSSSIEVAETEDKAAGGA